MMNLEEMLKSFITSKRAMGVSPRTIAWYKDILAPALLWLDMQTDGELQPHHIEAFLVHLRNRPKLTRSPVESEEGLSPETISSIHRALKIFFRWAVDRELLPRSPMRGIKVRKNKGTVPRRALREEVDQLIAGIDDDWIGRRDRLAIALMFFAGLRVGEMVQLEAAHFDLDRGLLNVPSGKTGAGVVPLLATVVDMFQSYLELRPAGYTRKLLVSSYWPGVPRRASLTPTGVRQMLIRRCKEQEIRYLNPHSFRHGIAMHLLNDKAAGLGIVQGVLRHSDIAITSRHYAKWTEEGLHDAFVAAMDD